MDSKKVGSVLIESGLIEQASNIANAKGQRFLTRDAVFNPSGGSTEPSALG